MISDKLKFLNEFDIFYQNLINNVKENKFNEKDFYLIIIAIAKSMDRERREKLILLNKEAK